MTTFSVQGAQSTGSFEYTATKLHIAGCKCFKPALIIDHTE
jgi:hypothetical protein